MVSLIGFILVGSGVGVVTIALFFFFMVRSWKIPVVNFKLVGDKRRPVLDLTRRAKIVVRNGVKYLKFRGTPDLWEMKNFKNEDYYQTTNGEPALIVFEFAKDCFAPVKPGLFAAIKKILGGKNEEAETLLREVPVFTPVGFELSETTLNGLLLKAIDDFDPDFILRNFGRIDRQYAGGLRAFLREFGWMIGWLLLFIIALVGIVMFFQKAPELAAACANAASDVGKNIIERAAAIAASGGGPAA